MTKKLIIGCGYLGSFIAREWSTRGVPVTGIVRSACRSGDLAAMGIDVRQQDITSARGVIQLEGFDSIVFAVGFSRRPDGRLDDGYLIGLRNVVGQVPRSCRRFIYISSTGVYGEQAGPITEKTPCRPQRDSSQMCWQAEQWLAESPVSDRLIILRLAGFYGPGRIPRLRELQAGEPLAVAPDGWMNVIRVEDAARAVVAADERAVPPCVYHIADGHPVQRREFFAYLAKLFGLPEPRYVSPSSDNPQAQRSRSSKQLDITAMVQQLHVDLQFPMYREGLADLAKRFPL